jgi:hypothetical protein
MIDMHKIVLVIALCSLLSFIAGCDKGIEPEPQDATQSGKTGFSGKVTFTGNWPAGIKRTHLVVFRNVIQSSSDFPPPNLAFVIDSIPYRSAVFDYNSIDNNIQFSILKLGLGDYSYVVVAQSKTPDLSLDRKDWFIVGIYYNGNDKSKPGVMTIQNGQMTNGININVDFSNPPQQPPGG